MAFGVQRLDSAFWDKVCLWPCEELTASVNGDQGVIAVFEIRLPAQCELGSNATLLVARCRTSSHGGGSKGDGDNGGSGELHLQKLMI
ncbi:hypothetical protein ED733_001315 [Metarhizium rileyi]|uniref:Uncharacterized protein n=1 Tax=Metarhizium rileyi (strain RCEF 4871) TaxID=1649241 RepID=A0A5C6G2T7_METRR|nr:hypothetical protein ED733_001315 [Metarhizium rileyi]